MLQTLKQALAVFPKRMEDETERLSPSEQASIEEYRLRIGYSPRILLDGTERELYQQRIQNEMLENILLHATGQAVYSAREMLKNGFLTLPGGHRLGICGKAIYRDGDFYSLKEISSLNLRIAREKRGFASSTANYLWTHPRSTLIIGPPGRGKTTLLRDLIYQLSVKFSWRVSVCDERMELAACYEGLPQFDLGPCTDVLSGANKADAIEILLRTMNPQWIAVDEITSEKDVTAMLRASYCGIRFLASAHASCKEELLMRPVYRTLIHTHIFKNLIVITKDRHLKMEEIDSYD